MNKLKVAAIDMCIKKMSRVFKVYSPKKPYVLGAAVMCASFFSLGFRAVFSEGRQTYNVGVSFQCSAQDIKIIDAELKNYFKEIGLKEDWIKVTRDPLHQNLNYVLGTDTNDVATINLHERKEYSIQNELVDMPTSSGKTEKVATVSKKEIVLAMLQHGRHTIFSGENCSAKSFIDHVGIRQNTVLWSQKLQWGWPDGGPAYWNIKFWYRGTPHAFVKITDAFMDSFLNQKLYGIGCYTATKLAMAHAVLDYYNRVSPNDVLLEKVIQNLMADGEPLVNIEPRKMWSFEEDFDHKEIDKPGKILSIMYGVAPMNFVPGDWVYMLNTHEGSNKKTGYEGSNAIYLGGGRFDDYYNDNNHSYTYYEKLNEVYQWENGVFSRSHDKDKIKPVSQNDYVKFGKHPRDGGYVLDLRTFHTFM